jgi:uroporphyrinogen decarboxylase
MINPENNKRQLELILNRQKPAYPPHFELVFFLEKEYLGFDRAAFNQGDPSSEAAADKDLQTKTFLVEKLGWSAVYGCSLVKNVDRFSQTRRLKKELGSKTLIFDFNGDGVFWMPTGNEMMDFVVKLFEQPKEMHTEARQKLEAAKKMAKQQRDAGVDFLVQNSDFGFNSGPFISPDHFAEFVTPYMTEFVGFVHELGLPVILHSDGNINKILDQLYSTGVDGYQSVDPQGFMDIKAVRDQFPDWILMGNVACNLLQDVDEPKICESVRYCMQYGGIGKRYIFSTSNCIFEGMPPQSYELMLEEYRRLLQNNLSRTDHLKRK